MCLKHIFFVIRGNNCKSSRIFLLYMYGIKFEWQLTISLPIYDNSNMLPNTELKDEKGKRNMLGAGQCRLSRLSFHVGHSPTRFKCR